MLVYPERSRRARVAERTNAPVCKTGDRKVYLGSNPNSSTKGLRGLPRIVALARHARRACEQVRLIRGSNPRLGTMEIKEKKLITKAWELFFKKMKKNPEVVVHTKDVQKIARKINREEISVELILAIIFHDIENNSNVKNHSEASILFFIKWATQKKLDRKIIKNVLKTLSGIGKEGKTLKSADAMANISSPANIPALLFRSWRKLEIANFQDGVIEARKKLMSKSKEINIPTAKAFKKKLRSDLFFLEKTILRLKEVENERT